MLIEEESRSFDHPVCKEEDVQFQQQLEGSITNKGLINPNISTTGTATIFLLLVTFMIITFWYFFGFRNILKKIINFIKH